MKKTCAMQMYQAQGLLHVSLSKVALQTTFKTWKKTKYHLIERLSKTLKQLVFSGVQREICMHFKAYEYVYAADLTGFCFIKQCPPNVSQNIIQ